MDTLFSGRYFLNKLQSIATSTVQSFLAKYLRKECGDLNEVASDNDDVKDDDDDYDYDPNRKDAEAWQVSKPEIPIKGRRELSCVAAMKFKLDKSAE